ncbi:hypothetical protein ACTQ5K_08845 [Niallia sp. Sow4_A1]|uniref:hypothetical protein n=1 Tax=unclassified Niallia TaxID=2837522 RepID=UPI0037C91696
MDKCPGGGSDPYIPIKESQATGMKIDTVIGDTAYSEKDNIRYTKGNNLELVSKLHPHITHGKRTKEEEFAFNKDAGIYVCKAGHMAIQKNMRRERIKIKILESSAFLILKNVKFVLSAKGV